jgi:hypothetical protein
MRFFLGIIFINQVLASDFQYFEWKTSFELSSPQKSYNMVELKKNYNIEQDCITIDNSIGIGCMKSISFLENLLESSKNKLSTISLEEINTLKLLETNIKNTKIPEYTEVQKEMKVSNSDYTKTQKYQYELYVSNYYKNSKKHIDYYIDIINLVEIKQICKLSKNDEIKQHMFLENACTHLKGLKKEYFDHYNKYLDQYYNQDFIVENNEEFDNEFKKKARLIPSIYDFIQFHEKVDVRRTTLQSWMLTEDDEWLN